MSDLDHHPFKRSAAAQNVDEPLPSASLAADILNAVPVGIIGWTSDGKCSLFNGPALSAMELEKGTLKVGMTLDAFLEEESRRGSLSQEDVAATHGQFALRRAFQFHFQLPNGDTVGATVRPLRGGGHVMSLTNETKANKAVTSAHEAQLAAEQAQEAATQVLMEERSRQRESDLLAEMDHWLQSCKTLEELYEILTAFMKMALPGTLGQVFIYSNSRDVLDLVCAWNSDSVQDHVTPDSCWALRRGRRYVYDPDVFSFVCEHAKEAKAQDLMNERSTCIPVIAHGETVGLLHIGELAEQASSDISDPFEFAKKCAEHVSLAVANVKLRDELQDQSTRDPLTSLYNRRFFLETMRREIKRAAALQSSFALVSFDADHFKTFNDKYGHDAGDAVLEGIADRMRGLDYNGAVCCRVGGEEFAIILPGADRTRAVTATEELLQAIEDMRVKYIGGRLPKVTVSAGVSIYPTHGTDPIDLIKQADLGLYAAKEAGRNCWRMNDGASLVTFD